jgi:hypothetical protein
MNQLHAEDTRKKDVQRESDCYQTIESENGEWLKRERRRPLVKKIRVQGSGESVAIVSDELFYRRKCAHHIVLFDNTHSLRHVVGHEYCAQLAITLHVFECEAVCTSSTKPHEKCARRLITHQFDHFFNGEESMKPLL